MAVLGSGVENLNDLMSVLDPNGKLLDISEILTLNGTDELFQDMTWMEGNLLTGHRDAARVALPEGSFRAINEGVPITKGAVTQIEETCAEYSDFSQADRSLAVLSGNVSAYRLKQAKPHILGAGHKMARTVFYGNANANPKEFTGLAPRYNTLDPAKSATATNVIDAGGTGTALRSMWLCAWSADTLTGIYPKNTKGGLKHEDATNAAGSGDGDGMPPAAVLLDANGNPFMGYRDHWEWKAGLMVKDWRYAVRTANVDVAALTKNATTGADIQDLMVQMQELLESTSGTRTAFYVPRTIRSFLRRQLLNGKNPFLSWDKIGGERVMMFGDTPIRRLDTLNINETRVTA